MHFSWSIVFCFFAIQGLTLDPFFFFFWMSAIHQKTVFCFSLLSEMMTNEKEFLNDNCFLANEKRQKGNGIFFQVSSISSSDVRFSCGATFC